MWGLITTVFLGLYGLMSFYIGRKGWISLGRRASRFYKIGYILIFSLLVLSFPLTEIGEDVLPPPFVPFLTMWGGYSMVATSYLFLTLLFIDIIRLLDRWSNLIPGFIKEHPKTPATIGAIVILLVFSIVVYGGWNARHPLVSAYQLSVPKAAGALQQLRIAMLSDLHYGAIIDTGRLERMLEMVEEIKPDVILLAGDLTDGSLPPGEGQKLADVLARMKAPYGTFAVPGNHDRDLRSEDSELMMSLTAAGIHVLKDDFVTVGDSFHLIGRDDPNRRIHPRRAELKEMIKGIDPSLPLIMLDHQPIDLQEAQENGVDLQLSGHTHNGQIFPANLITGQLFEEDWGLLDKGAYRLIVSSGYGTWGPPLRIGNHPEVVSITLTFDREGSQTKSGQN